MWYVYCGLVLSIGIGVISWKREGFVVGTLSSVLAVIVLFLLSYPILGLTTGLCPNYEHGMYIGHITKIKKSGILLETYEGEALANIGSKPFKFSIPNRDVLSKVASLRGRKAILIYNSWLITPFRIGESSHVLSDVLEMRVLD